MRHLEHNQASHFNGIGVPLARLLPQKEPWIHAISLTGSSIFPCPNRRHQKLETGTSQIPPCNSIKTGVTCLEARYCILYVSRPAFVQSGWR